MEVILKVHLKKKLQADILSTSGENCLRRVSQKPIDDKSSLVQVMD